VYARAWVWMDTCRCVCMEGGMRWARDGCVRGWACVGGMCVCMREVCVHEGGVCVIICRAMCAVLCTGMSM